MSACSKVIPRRAISLRMKLVVPLTIPCTRSIRAPASDSCSTRITGTTPATAPSKRSCTPNSPAAAGQLVAVLGEQLLVGCDDVPAGPHRLQHIAARRLDPADQLDDQLGVVEEVSAKSPLPERDSTPDISGRRPVIRWMRAAWSTTSSAKAPPTVPRPRTPIRNTGEQRLEPVVVADHSPTSRLHIRSS